MSIEAMKLALEALENHGSAYLHHEVEYSKSITALSQAIEQAQQAEPVTILPDGSAFAVMSWPLPKNHWLYAEREYRDGEYEPVELGNPILTHQLRDEVVSAVRYAIRGATNCGKDVDFDPDALVQNAVYALCGPYKSPVATNDTTQERVAETSENVHEPCGLECDCTDVCKQDNYKALWQQMCDRCDELDKQLSQRQWVGLTKKEFQEAVDGLEDLEDCWVAIEAKIKEKNT